MVHAYWRERGGERERRERKRKRERERERKREKGERERAREGGRERKVIYLRSLPPIYQKHPQDTKFQQQYYTIDADQ